MYIIKKSSFIKVISILLVDDEESLLDLGARFLYQREQITVQSASSAQKAREILEKSTFDAIVSDYDMPEMNGIAFLKTIRSEYNDVPFILFTGKGREEVVIDAINNGADFYVQKGGEPKAQFAELAHKIRQAVDKHQAYTTIKEKTAEMKKITEETLKFISLKTREEILTHLGEVLEEFIRNSIIVTISSFSEGNMKIHSIHGIDTKTIDQINQILTINLMEQNFITFPEYKSIFLTGRLYKHINNLAYFAQGVIPEPICRVLEKMFHITHLYSVGLTTGIADGGSVHIFCRDGDFIRNPQSVETLVFQASLALERVHTAEEMQKRETEYENIINHIQDVYYRTAIDGKIQMVSPSGTRMFGYDSDEEVIGMSAYSLWVYPSALERKKTALLAEGSINDFEATLFCKDGSTLNVSLTSHLIYDTAGSVIGAEGVIRDITKRKKEWEQLLASEEQYKSVFINCPYGIAVLDTIDEGTDCIILDINPAAQRILNQSHETIITKGCKELFAINSKHVLMRAIKQVYLTKEQNHLPVTWYQNDMFEGWFDMNLYLLSSGKLLFIFSDITDYITKAHELSCADI